MTGDEDANDLVFVLVGVLCLCVGIALVSRIAYGIVGFGAGCMAVVLAQRFERRGH